MRRSRLWVTAATLASTSLIAGGLAGFAAKDATTNAANMVAAIHQVDPTAVSDVAVPVKSDAGTAVLTQAPEGGAVSVPKDPSDGVQLLTRGDGPHVTIGLPFAKRASDAANSPVAGVVVYDNNNGSSTVPVARGDGSIQISTVIESANAPKRYDYPIRVPQGASLTQSPEGVVAVVAADGAPLTVFGDAWAKDARGAAVATRFEVHGNTLTQVVETDAQTAFPVVADPATTGVYSYNCVNSNGSSYFMKPGENLVNCKGSYLQKYINGKMVKSVALVYNGATKVRVTGAGWCVVSLAGVATLAFFPPTATFAWAVAAGTTLLGAYSSCKDI